MCGIAGYINFKNRIENTIKIKRIINSINHSGKHHDNRGYWISKYKCFLNKYTTKRNLMFINHQGNQSFISDDGRYVIIFNGEIYNFKLLKEKLKEYNFQSNSDSLKYFYICI